jgi:DNA-binding GntR family transcriptional regulator
MNDIPRRSNNFENIGKAEKAFLYIQKQILERKIIPGQRIVERAIAQECGMSKTPVREALQRLKDLGLVSGDFQTGVYVINITGKDALEIFDLREVLEGLSARLATENANQESIQEIEDILEESRFAMDSNDAKRYSDLDQEFHFLMMRLGENDRLFEIYHRLRVQASILMRSSMRLPDRGMEKSFNEHMAIFEMMKKGDTVNCERSARQHIVNTRDAVQKWLQQNLFL